VSVLDEIVGRLVSEGVGLVDQTIFKSTAANLPRGAGPYLSVIETGGMASAKTHNDTATARPTLQLKARASGAVAARAMLKAAYDALGGENGLYNITLGGIFYLRIVARQGPTDTGQDEAGRATYSFNVEIEKQPS
jgi:hypothetical protein